MSLQHSRLSWTGVKGSVGGYNRVTYDVEDVEEDQAASYGRETAQPDCHTDVSRAVEC